MISSYLFRCIFQNQFDNVKKSRGIWMGKQLHNCKSGLWYPVVSSQSVQYATMHYVYTHVMPKYPPQIHYKNPPPEALWLNENINIYGPVHICSRYTTPAKCSRNKFSVHERSDCEHCEIFSVPLRSDLKSAHISICAVWLIVYTLRNVWGHFNVHSPCW